MEPLVVDDQSRLAKSNRMDVYEVQTREDLAQYLSASLPGDYTQPVGEGEVRNVATHVKSYLMEAHTDGQLPIQERLTRAFLEVARLEDSSLLRVSRDNVFFFVDAGDPRFLVLHSTAPIKETDALFLKLTEPDMLGFDHAWLPGPFLNRNVRGALTGFKFRYETSVAGVEVRRIDSSTGEILEPRQAARFSMSVADDQYAAQEYRNLIAADVFEGRKALEQVQFRAIDLDEPSDVIVNSIYSKGKLVGKGTSIAGHLFTVASLLDGYRNVIRSIEQEFAIGWVPAGGGLVHNGEPFVFRFPNDVAIVDLASFVESVFSSSLPFRLFGIPHRASDDRIDVEAIDLHTGDPLSFEIGRDWMRVFLPRGSCGNIIARLYTNLLHAMSAEIALTVGGIDPFSEPMHAL